MTHDPLEERLEPESNFEQDLQAARKLTPRLSTLADYGLRGVGGAVLLGTVTALPASITGNEKTLYAGIALLSAGLIGALCVVATEAYQVNEYRRSLEPQTREPVAKAEYNL